MFLLAVDLAIFSRLTGAPLDNQGRPQLDSATKIPVNRHRVMPPESGGGVGPSYGIRIPSLKTGQDLLHGLTSKDPSATRLYGGFSADTFRQVPVFDENVEGRNYADIFPSVTFRMVNAEFDPEVFLYHEPYSAPAPGALVEEITNRYGDTIDSGYDGYTLRPHPDSYKLRYAVVIQAKSRMELSLIFNQVVYLLPAKGSLEVRMADGTSHVSDMFQVDIVDQSPGFENSKMGVSGEEQRHFKTALYYDVEAYVDNTTSQFGNQNPLQTNVILERVIELNSIQERLCQRLELNAEEMGPI